MNEPTKSQKRHLRELAAKAWDRELTAALGALQQQFALWQAGKMDAWELSERVHKYHNGIAQDLYKTYDGSKSLYVIAGALARDVLAWDEVPDDCEPMLRNAAKEFNDDGSA